jgi:hypothetical protein
MTGVSRGLRRQGLRSSHLPLAKPQEHTAMSAPDFTVDVFQNEYLPDGAREVNAIVTVTSAGSAADWTTGPTSADEIIIVDCSPSMEVPGKKQIQVRRATAAAIDVIRDGTAFAVVAGAGRAWPLYPKCGGLAIADARTREAAKRSVRRLRTRASTAIGQWLRLARELFQTREDTLRHAILLTDGQNVGESPADLAAAIELCVGVFSCDCTQVIGGLGRPERAVLDALLGDGKRERVGAADRGGRVLAAVDRGPAEGGGDAADVLGVEDVDRAKTGADRGGQGVDVGLGAGGDDRAGVAQDDIGQEGRLQHPWWGHHEQVLF